LLRTRRNPLFRLKGEIEAEKYRCCGISVCHSKLTRRYSVTHMPGTIDKSLNTTDVYAIHGADPEVLAYAMAKYSRSAPLSARVAPRRSAPSVPSSFLNTFLLPVRPPFDRRSCARSLRYRAVVAARRHLARRRATLGRAGALYPLSGLHQIRLVYTVV